MQHALPYRNFLPSSAGQSPPSTSSNVKKVVDESAVVVFARRGCCMCHVVKLLLHGHGVSPAIVDVDDQNEGDVTEEISKIGGGGDGVVKFPAVFVGGELFGGLEDVMGAHISGELVPRLKKAKALWL